MLDTLSSKSEITTIFDYLMKNQPGKLSCLSIKGHYLESNTPLTKNTT